MNRTLFEAILAMDAYNRGYDPGIELLETNIGSATLGIDSGELKDENDVRLDQGINFYAISYSYAGETIIAYRGTDSLVGDYFLDGDIWNGYGVGGGSIAGNQALMAFQFYQRVAGLDPATMTEVDLKSADISLVGHSMGGGTCRFSRRSLS